MRKYYERWSNCVGKPETCSVITQLVLMLTHRKNNEEGWKFEKLRLEAVRPISWL
jgi:hypothetical protein